ncbi:MAG: dienelactone hydrolase family protein [Planctomycetales bacterium]|nr:dienelactone hydrolase family protein [Planctomycetales bacterium]
MFRDKLLQGLGGPWPQPCSLDPVIGEVLDKPGYRIEKLSFLAEPDDRVPALLLVPDGVAPQTPAPGICVWHQHAGQYHLGKSEPAGLAGNPEHHTAAALARLGYVVLCIDALGFEERQAPEPTGLLGRPRLQNGDYERFLFLQYLVAGKTLAWKNILDMRRAVDYLESRPEVRPDQLGCYGHSMGSTHTWLVGGWEPRLRALVGNCCLPTYRGIHREQLLHCFPNFVPGIYPEADTPDIAALIAPRPFHLNFGELDTGSPVDEARRGAEQIAETYRQKGVPQNFSYFVEAGVGHSLTDAMWEKTRAFFKQHLPIA